MLRRNPTRIELKLDDREEYEQLKREREVERKAAQSSETTEVAMLQEPSSEYSGKTKQEIIQMRIGYDPTPLPQISNLPVH